MRRARGLLLVAATLAVGLAACGGSEDKKTTDEFPRGGTLRIALEGFAENERRLAEAVGGQPALDPQWEFSLQGWELFRCCLLRTLVSYVGKPTAEGGAVLRPDLAQGMPSISADGLTWTFRLKEGIRYGPPLEKTEVVAADFIRALERFGKLVPNAAGPFQNVEGFPEFAEGKADSIAGLEAADPRTLVVHLTRPAGDLGNVLASPFAAPLPPRAADGHDKEYGRFLVSSGPYMLAGSGRLDFSRPPDAQKPVPGYLPGKRVVLVRNPSWSRATDRLRPANVDRIEVDDRRRPDPAGPGG